MNSTEALISRAKECFAQQKSIAVISTETNDAIEFCRKLWIMPGAGRYHIYNELSLYRMFCLIPTWTQNALPVLCNSSSEEVAQELQELDFEILKIDN